MISVLIAIAALIIGYFLYGKLTDKIFGSDDRETPAYKQTDGVDFVPMPTRKVFLIQLLNIAGTGPIFGALSGAAFGPVVYLWIVFGSIFIGGVHDFMVGMISMRNKGASVAELTGKYLGNGMKKLMRLFSVILLVMCGVVFTTGPAGLLNILTGDTISVYFWGLIITVYYFIATFVPIDKIIGHLYPVFGLCLIIMAIGVLGSLLFSGQFTMPEVWDNFTNKHADGLHIWPFLFITVACGAVSGFHATQSPIMARCCTNERDGRKIFYGAMLSEGIIALVWAAAGVSCYDSSRALLDAGAGCSAVVYNICTSTMGQIGGIFAIIGVIVCPISSGDTAYRSARLTLSDWFGLNQQSVKNRLLLTIPLLAAGTFITQLNYSIVWRYFSWSNQTLAMIVLWTATVFLASDRIVHFRFGWILTFIPAFFMTAVTTTYFVSASECMGILWNAIGITQDIYYPAAVIAGILFAVLLSCIFLKRRIKNSEPSFT